MPLFVQIKRAIWTTHLPGREVITGIVIAVLAYAIFVRAFTAETAESTLYAGMIGAAVPLVRYGLDFLANLLGAGELDLPQVDVLPLQSWAIFAATGDGAYVVVPLKIASWVPGRSPRIRFGLRVKNTDRSSQFDLEPLGEAVQEWEAHHISTDRRRFLGEALRLSPYIRQGGYVAFFIPKQTAEEHEVWTFIGYTSAAFVVYELIVHEDFTETQDRIEIASPEYLK